MISITPEHDAQTAPTTAAMTRVVCFVSGTCLESSRLASRSHFSGGIEAVRRNADRILANVKMLELNVSDVVGLN